jgi:hypothetical protein
MADLVLVAILVAFIALCVAYVAWCDHIIGVDDAVAVSTTESNTGSAPATVDQVVSSAVRA